MPSSNLEPSEQEEDLLVAESRRLLAQRSTSVVISVSQNIVRPNSHTFKDEL